MSAELTCRGCGTPADPEGIGADRCESCPPRECLDCGQMDSMQAPCKCWVSIADMSVADLKGLFAHSGLGVGPAVTP